MNTRRTKLVAGTVSLVAGLLVFSPLAAEATIDATSQRLKPPMPCVLVRINQKWTGFCPSPKARTYSAPTYRAAI